MKRTLLVLLLFVSSATAVAQIVPTPTHDTPSHGSFYLSHSTTVSYDVALAPLAEYLHDYLGLEANPVYTSNNALILRLDAGYTPEAYTLRIQPSRIEIVASDFGGVFNGIQTLFQLLPPEVYTRQMPLPAPLACRTIDDAPRFGYRGMMLDVCRTWMDVPAIQRYIDLLSYHKINKLHLHLSDDEGWRIEIKSHPDLAQIGGFRGGDSPIRPVYGKWSEKYGGYFTQDQMRALIAYAAARNIEIIPEIDLPGHSRNIARVRPEILCNYTPDTTVSNGYDMRSAWCVARRENYALLDDILGELCELFPSKYIHIGGDEVEVSQWDRCPDCRALKCRMGIQDTHLLQDHFMQQVVAILEKHGKHPVVWNEASRSGKLTRNSLISGWESVKACLDATAKGYNTVVMPGQYFYFDMRQTPREDGHDWAAIFDAKKVYEFGFNDFTPGQMKYVAGLEATFFSEAYISHEPEKPDYIDYMCFPRICALSEIAWHGNTAGWDAFYNTLQQAHYNRMAAMDIRFRLSPPEVVYKEGQLIVTTPDHNSEIYFNKGHNSGEHLYTCPIATDEPHRYLFRTRYKTGRSPFVGSKAYYHTITPGLKLSTSMGEGSIPYANVEGYKTFARTSRACREGDWILYEFTSPVACREIYLQTGNRQLPKTIITTGYVEVSYNGTTFVREAELEKGSATLHPSRAVRAVRIVSTCHDNGCAYVTIQPPQIKPKR